jgi:hypothetical protein
MLCETAAAEGFPTNCSRLWEGGHSCRTSRGVESRPFDRRGTAPYGRKRPFGWRHLSVRFRPTADVHLVGKSSGSAPAGPPLVCSLWQSAATRGSDAPIAAAENSAAGELTVSRVKIFASCKLGRSCQKGSDQRVPGSSPGAVHNPLANIRAHRACPSRSRRPQRTPDLLLARATIGGRRASPKGRPPERNGR